MEDRVVFFGVVQDGDDLGVIGYGTNCRPVGPVVRRFPLGIEWMFVALAVADALTEGLK